jgi:hypothetical protein
MSRVSVLLGVHGGLDGLHAGLEDYHFCDINDTSERDKQLKNHV